MYGTQLPATEAQNHLQLYDIKKSPTARVVQGAASTFQMAYQSSDDYVSGIVVLETVQIGGATVENQAIGVATAIGAGELADGGFSGIIGFDFSSQDTSTSASITMEGRVMLTEPRQLAMALQLGLTTLAASRIRPRSLWI